ncbi:hypothetical protein KYN89_00125 [Alteriqipengyuania sp. NZ-12B]|uniref:Uncharacterized protein n=1 Tax=Alteriqipengyuania abyssalis TaxID=2860200 RepID=A0ABS7P8Q4_9SPHN|nr:hypothetical protein [Alteriqipengyuania abyssalis]MBY8335444.1 hypothetical protein [Alteriqipengyuania abyssalis]
MDFGFGALIDKFEEYFGKRWTAALLACIGLFVVSVTLRGVYTGIVEPVFSLFVSDDRLDQPGYIIILNVASFLVVVLAVLAGRYIGQKYWNMDRYMALHRLQRMKGARLVRKTDKLTYEAKKDLASARALLEDGQAIRDEVLALLREFIATYRKTSKKVDEKCHKRKRRGLTHC